MFSFLFWLEVSKFILEIVAAWVQPAAGSSTC